MLRGGRGRRPSPSSRKLGKLQECKSDTLILAFLKCDPAEAKAYNYLKMNMKNASTIRIAPKHTSSFQPLILCTLVFRNIILLHPFLLSSIALANITFMPQTVKNRAKKKLILPVINDKTNTKKEMTSTVDKNLSTIWYKLKLEFSRPKRS